jgi:VanZ family protein
MRFRHSPFIRWLLLGVIVLIAYGSLYPFNFKPDAISGGVFQALRQLSWARAGRADQILNVLLYLPLGFCLYLWFGTRLAARSAGVVSVLFGAALSLALEVAQVYVSIRVPSFADVALNTLGTVLGVIGGVAWRSLARLMYLPTRDEQPERDPCAALLIGLWLAWRWAPFVPNLDLAKLKAAFRPLISPHLDSWEIITYLTYWLVINQALAQLATRARRLESLLLLIAAVLLGRLIVANQAFIASELAALLALLPMVVLMYRVTPTFRRVLLICGLVAVFVIEYLAPFDLTSMPGRFDLWPFLTLLDDPLAVLASYDWVGLLGKLFSYGALIWVLKDAGFRLNLAVGVVVAAVFAIEVLQLWLPGQISSITDPLLALAVGLAFRSVHKRARRQAFSVRPI